MIRITETGRDPERVSLAVEGCLVGEDAQLLDIVCTAILNAGQSIHLDCSGVTFVDVGGAIVLRRLRAGKLIISSCAPIILEILDQAPAP